MKRYDEIMNKIKVDEGMKQRLLSYVEQLDLQTQKEEKESQEQKIHRLYERKIRNIAAAAACIAAFLVCIFALPQISKRTLDDAENSVAVSNGIAEVDSAKELASAVGFPVSEVKGLPFKIEKEIYASYWGEMAQIEYIGENETAVFRKGMGTEDVSGDYNEYPQVKEFTIDGYSVTLKGGNDKFSLAVWTDGTYSCSLAFEKGMSESDWITLIRQDD